VGSGRLSSVPNLVLAVAMALLVIVPAAIAAEGELTRDEYVAKVEPICKQNSDANSRILKGVKEQVTKKDELVPAGQRFIRASAALAKTVDKIAAVPQPSADSAKLTKWIGYLEKEQTFLQRIGKKLKAKDKYHAEKLAQELNSNNNKANNTVISFNFHECRIDSSRFL
jgi:hypothetical protein